jgi:hypothetical protein
MKQRVLSLFLALTLCLTLLPTAALATENETSAQSAEEALLSTEGAEGTAENPILIGSLDELNKFVYRVNEDGWRELCAQLTADITLGDSWTSIGNNLAYIGTFDGNGHTIYAENGVANLFGRIGKAGRVQGLTVEIGTMTAPSGSGVIARENSGTIERCSVRIYGMLTISSYFGLIAYDNAGTIEHCRSSVSKFSASGSAKAAGIAYTNYKSGTIKSCYFNGKFRYDETTGAQDYAITSSLRGGTVENCYCLNGQLYYDKHNYLDESLPGLHGAAQRQHHNKTYDYTLESGQVTWLLNNGEGASTNNTEPWRLDKQTYGGTPTLDPADGRVTKSGDTYTWETLHTHMVGGKLHEFEALDSTPSGSGYYYLDANTTLSGTWNITGETVLCLNGNTLTTSGNAITVAAGGTLTLMTHDKKTPGGAVTGAGTIVELQGGTLVMQGGTISGGTMGVELPTDSTFRMEGGEISGNTVGVHVKSGDLTLGGKAQVTGNDKNILLAANQKIHFDSLDPSAKFGISVAGQESLSDRVAVTDTTGGRYFAQLVADGFKNDGLGFELYLSNDGNTVMLGKQSVHTHCICGDSSKNVNGHTHDAGITFQPWTKTDELPTSGDYYLTRNVTLARRAVSLGNANVCLNGYTVTLSDVGRINPSGTTQLTDCSVNGKGKLESYPGKANGGVTISGGNKFCLYGGTLNGVKVEIGQTGGGTFNMYGGKITNNTAASAVAGQNFNKININIYGGEISGNHTSADCGGVWVGAGNAFKMSGGAIRDNSGASAGGVGFTTGNTTYKNGSMTVSGSAVIQDNTANGSKSNVRLPASMTIAIDGELTQGAKIGVRSTATTPGAITGNNSADMSGYFTSDDPRYKPADTEDTHAVTLTSLPTPEIKKGEDVTQSYGTEGGKVTLNSSNTEGYTLSYQWYQNNEQTGTGTSIPGATGAEYPIPKDTPVGTYYYYCVVQVQELGETITTQPSTVTITRAAQPRPLTVSTGWDYGSTVPQPTVTGLPAGVTVDQATVTYTDARGYVITPNSETPVGNYHVKVEYTDSNAAYSGEADFEVTPMLVNRSWVQILDAHTTYDGTTKNAWEVITVTVTVNGKTITLSSDDFHTSGVTAAADASATPKRGQLTLQGNYQLQGNGGIDFTWYIDPLEAELELVNADGRKYGDGNGNVTMRVKNATEHSPVTVTCTGGDDLSVGEHTVTATALSNENYKLPDEGSKRTLTYTVAKGEETLPEADITMNGWTYGQTPTTPSVKGLPAGVTPTFTYKTEGGTEITPTYTTDAGAYTVTVRAGTDDTVYTVTKPFTVAPKTLTKADIGEYGPNIPNKVYDGSTGFDLTGLGTKKTALVGALGANDVLYIGGTSEFADANAGDTELIFTTNGKLSTFPGGAVKPGNYTIANGLTKSFAARIDQRWLDFTVDSVSKRYGSDTADVRVTFTGVSGNSQSGLVDGEQLVQGVDYDVTATFSRTDFGTDNNVTVNITLKDTAKAKNYRLVSGKTVTSGEIKKAAAPNVPEQIVEIYSNAVTRYPIDLKKGWPAGTPSIFDYTYDGRYDPELNAGELSELLYQSASFTCPAVDDWNGTIYLNINRAFTADVGADLGVLKLKFKFKSANYDDVTLCIRFKIKAKAQKTLAVNLEGWTYGEAANLPAYTAPAGATETTLTYTSRDGQTSYGATPPTDAGDYTLTVRCEGIDTIWTGTADFTIARKPIAPPAADTTKFAYTALEQTYQLAANAAYTISPNTTQTNAGSYTVTVSLNDTANTEWTDGTTAAKEYTFTISAAKLTVTALDKRITAGQSAPDLTTPVLGEDYKVDGLLGQDALTAVTLTYGETPDTSKTGSYTINISAEQANYDITTVPGTLTITPRPSSGGGSTTYPVNTPNKTENGTVTVSPRYAERGDTVTITVKPDDGFKLDELTVTDKNGNELKLTDKGNGKYTFTMPASKVEIKATFVKEVETSPFSDVSTSAYYYEAVKWAQEKGITGGIGNGLFGPNQPCTRAQIVTFLWRAAGSPEPKAMSSFADVSTDAYYAKAVAWAVENGITTGTGDGKFSPDAACTRAQSVTFLFRAIGKLVDSKAEFSDVLTDSYYANAVAWAVENGVTNGIGDGLFGPDNSCTRAQIVTFLFRAYQGK